MRKFKFLSVILSVMVFIGSFAACNPNTSSTSSPSSSQDPTSVHTCESVCEICEKCTDAECTEDACADKCQGHTQAPAHTCESVCPTCNKCTDTECTETVCADKCQGHTTTPTHTCESKCATCQKCTDTTCTETVCADKCQGHTQAPAHTCESVCPTCNKCTDTTCTETVCADKCQGHTVGVHTCETACRTCGLCMDETCTEEACKNKCAHTGYVDIVCKTCGLCIEEECNGEACGGKCPGHTEGSKYIDYRKDIFKDKVALFVGDSICRAFCEVNEDITGWPGRIEYSTSMKCVNKGVSGASISTNGPNPGADGKSAKRILTQYLGVKDQHFDYVIMQGGVNDAWVESPVGTITDSFAVEDFNIDTYAGALEELFYHVTKNHSNAKLGYIFTFKTPKFDTGRIEDMTEYYNMAKQICEKWNVPFLNMYEDATLNEELKVNTNENLSDYLHPSPSGYDVLYKYIMYWMETLPIYSEIKEGDKLETLPADVLPSEPDLGCTGSWTDFY